MALSPTSRHRSRIIREMSRDLNKPEHSCVSSSGSQHGTVSDSSVSDFDPENEAIMSTRQMDFDLSQRLPELRDTAKKYGRWNGGRQPDFVINTSAIGRAFPDFTQGSSSEDSFSVEYARGAKTRQRTPTQEARPKQPNNLNIDSPIVTIGDFQILSTPPMKPQSKPAQQQDAPRSSARKDSQAKRTASNTIQKENIPPPNDIASPKNMMNYLSGATRTSSGEQRRTLAEIHARVADESDGSFINDERPAIVTVAAKNSRFSNFQPRNSPLATRTTKSKTPVTDAQVEVSAVLNALQSSTPSPPQRNATVNSNNPTSQSFLLPNMPDISELVSGTFKNGTPVFTRNGKVQSRLSPHGPNHNVIDGIPVPQEEKDIFLSLQLLQEKVAALEMEKADSQRTVDELLKNNYQLQAKNKEFQKRYRSDSALGMADSGSDGEYARDKQNLVAEKTKLEAQLKSLQARFNASERKVANQDLRLKTNTAERDQAVKQLAEAFYSTEELKSENEALRRENAALKEQLAVLVSENEESARKWQQKETSLQKKLQRSVQAVSEIRETTREIKEAQHDNIHISTSRTVQSTTARSSKNKRKTSGQVSEQATGPKNTTESNGQKSGRGRTLSDQLLSDSQTKSNDGIRPRSRSQGRHFDNEKSRQQSTLQCNDDGETFGTESVDEGSSDETTKTIREDNNVNVNGDSNDMERTQESNFSSILGHGEMEQLRQILKNERAKQQERLAAGESTQFEDDTVRSTRSDHSARSVRSAPEVGRPLQRKTSAKGLTGILKNGGAQDQDDMTGRLSIKSGGLDNTIQSNASHKRRHSENWIHTRINTHRRVVAEEMTSAFIIPDITIHGTSHGTEHPVLSAEARRVLDNLAHHDGHNCTVCSRVASFEKDRTTTNVEVKRAIHVEKPVPVSDRMPIAGPYEDEPTMRPSVAPGLALATVLKALKDELAHLKMEHAQYQALYNQQDPSLGMRKRKSIKCKIDKLLKAMDTKADQIYALYDVLEGQKQSGQELSEKEVEITLQSIGVDMETMKPKQVPDEDCQSDAESELDLPWEGIEETTGTGSVKERRHSYGV